MKYVFLDLETPNRKNSSICSIGFIVCDNDVILEKRYFLINPEDSFDDRNVEIHGITKNETIGSPTFAEFWDNNQAYFADCVLVAHNASFDLSTLYKTANTYDIQLPTLQYLCTCDLAKKYMSTKLDSFKLPILCNHFGIALTDHHNALADTKACYEVFLALMGNCGIQPEKEVQTYRFKMSRVATNPKLSSYESETDIHTMVGFKKFCEAILEDGSIDHEEVYFLVYYIEQNPHLQGEFPFDKIAVCCEEILADHIIEDSEIKTLHELLQAFVNPAEGTHCDCIQFQDKLFCLSGDFDSGSKSQIKAKITALGGLCKDGVTLKTDYLVVGGSANSSWKFGNYGTKVAKALQMQEKGNGIQILSEEDLCKCLD